MDTICIVIDGISNSGGTDRVAANLSNMFTEHGYDVTLCPLSTGEPYYFISDKVNIIQPKFRLRLRLLYEVACEIKKKKFTYTIIISMGRLSFQLVPLLRIISSGTKIICSDHVSIESFPFYVRFMKYFSYFLSDKLVVLTEHDKRFLKAILKNKDIDVIRNQSPFSIEVDNEKEKVAIAVGRLSAQKNFSRLLDIWVKAKTDDWCLYIIGDGEEKNLLSNKIKSNHLSNVKIISATKDLRSWYKRSSLLLMTSRYEGLPMVLIEAKSFGLPVIAFDCKTGPQEIIRNDGVLVEYHDDEHFVRALNELMFDHERRYVMSSIAIENALRYSESSIFEQWLKVIK